MPYRRVPGRVLPILAGTLLILLLAWALLMRWIDSQPIGTGESVPSPNDLHMASVMAFPDRSFWTDETREWFEFRISGPGLEKRLTTSPIPGPDFGSRSGHRVIHWDADSAAVRFAFPTVTLRVEARPDAP